MKIGSNNTNKICIGSDIVSAAYLGSTKVYGVTPDDIITFADAEVKRICVENWGGHYFDGEITRTEAARVTNEQLGETFKSNTIITSFDEFQYFTGVTSIFQAFRDCTALTSIILPSSLTNLGGSTFNKCTALTNVVIPDSVTILGTYVFYVCSHLTEVTIPNSVTSIGTGAFQNANRLKTVIVNSNTPPTLGNTVFNTNASDRKIIVPFNSLDAYKSATNWSTYANDITSVIPFEDANVKAICVSNWGGNYVDGEITLAEAAAVTSNQLGQTFRGNTDIVSFNELQYFTGVTSINTQAFRNCTNLQSITLPQSVTTIEGIAFAGDTSLTSIIIPQLVTNIAGRAFYNCTSLAQIIVEPTTPPTLEGTEVFYLNSSDKKFYVPPTSAQTYKTAEGWSNYADSIMDYLCFVASEDGTFSFTNNVSYSLDWGVTWNTLSANTASPTIATGETICWKGNITPDSTNGSGTFSSTGRFNAIGNPLSLTNGDNYKNITTSSNYCFCSLFYECSGLIDASDLQLIATTTGYYSYGFMFRRCSNLINAPKLPAMTLGALCYAQMFRECTSLVKAPDLPAIAIGTKSYSLIFNGATNIAYIKALFTTTPTESWVYNVASTGIFVKNINATWDVIGDNGVPSGWTVIYYDSTEDKYYKDRDKNVECDEYGRDYLAFTALEDGTFQFTNTVNYSLDSGRTWTELSANTASPTITTGNSIMWKGSVTPVAWQGIGIFSSTGRFNASGDPLSLIYNDNFSTASMQPHSFGGLFKECTTIIDASNLKIRINKYAHNCCREMFKRCTNLVSAPDLSSTVTSTACYQDMFLGCSALVNISDLNATAIYSYAYDAMFKDCTSIVNPPKILGTTIFSYGCRSMFSGCSSLVTAPTLYSTEITNYCYYAMFKDCTSLTTAPELIGLNLATHCYSYMFFNCSNINYIKALFTDTPTSEELSNWVNGVAASGIFVKNKDATWNVVGVNGVPSGWTVVDAYDAEVEYLESNGEELITTQIIIANNNIIELDTVYTETVDATKILACFSTNAGCWVGAININKFAIGTSEYLGDATTRELLTFEMDLATLTSTLSSDGTTVTRTINPPNPGSKLLIFGYSSGYKGKVRIYSCKLTQDGTLVLDFIPVRVGTVGYMFDRVSGKLFGNSGSGAFTYGADVANQ